MNGNVAAAGSSSGSGTSADAIALCGWQLTLDALDALRSLGPVAIQTVQSESAASLYKVFLLYSFYFLVLLLFPVIPKWWVIWEHVPLVSLLVTSKASHAIFVFISCWDVKCNWKQLNVMIAADKWMDVQSILCLGSRNSKLLLLTAIPNSPLFCSFWMLFCFVDLDICRRLIPWTPLMPRSFKRLLFEYDKYVLGSHLWITKSSYPHWM